MENKDPNQQCVPGIPVLPLRDAVIFPFTVVPLFVERGKSIRSLERALTTNKKIFLLAQKDPSVNEPSAKDLHLTGTVATVLQMLRLPDNTVKVLVEGEQRGVVLNLSDEQGAFYADVEMVEESELNPREAEIFRRSLMSQFERYVKLNKKIRTETLTTLNSIEDVKRLVDTIAAHIPVKLEGKQKILEKFELSKRIEHVIAVLEAEIELMEVERRIRGRVKKQMQKSQKEYYLNEQVKAIQKELGDSDDEFEELEKKVEEAGMPKEAKEKSLSELKKLKMMPPMSAEATVVRNYIECMVEVPWKKKKRVMKDLAKAEDILESDHYGLEKVKERILEYLAVMSKVKKSKEPILCLVGPPGVGKTSLGQSMARATDREFIRMALGGVRDESEIRGHRRTYIGSMPGKIIQKLCKAKVRNPLFLLDEIDKMSSDFRGDPASAMLEVLDPEQNHTFNDHYLDVDYDLSDVMFVATANSLATIPRPLLDRMEILRIEGYTEDEKFHIAKKYLIEKQMSNNGLKKNEFNIDDKSIYDIIRYYTRESGVRSLDRMISKTCRKVVKEILLDKRKTPVKITPKNLSKYLGARVYRYGITEGQDKVGQVMGLAWTEFGGEILTIEAVSVPGKGKVSTTGSLGDVMEESIQAAVTVVRYRTKVLGIQPEFFEKNDLHIHVPEGATPKDGPSAGIAMCTALVSAITNNPVLATVAMTGEITLRGDILPIGGLKEKLLAAKRGGIEKVLIPKENEKDLAEIPKEITGSLNIICVKYIDEVLEIALKNNIIPLSDGEEKNESMNIVSKPRKSRSKVKDNVKTH